MGRNITSSLWYDSNLTETFLVPAGSTRNLDIDIKSIYDAKLLVEVYYATTAGTTGVSCTVFYGIGGAEENDYPEAIPCKLGAAGSTTTSGWGATSAVFSDNSDAVTMATVTTGSTNVIKQTYFALNNTQTRNTRWCRLQFTNNDLTNQARIKVRIDH